ncbi:MAG: hypothetical protein JXA11_08625 [Phycisphaerae bacterium]|nr:hypothetical protein [Phycisphaerae bacterium]
MHKHLFHNGRIVAIRNFVSLFLLVVLLTGVSADARQVPDSPIFLSEPALQHLRHPTRSMPAEFNKEISAVLKENFEDVIDVVMGPRAEKKFNAVTTLGGGRGDWDTKMNRLEVVADLKVTGLDGKPAEVSLYIYFYTNDQLADKFSKASAQWRERIQKAIQDDEKYGKIAREKNYSYRPKTLPVSPYVAIADYNGWTWNTDDSKMKVTLRHLGNKVSPEWIKERTLTLHRQLANAGLYHFYQRLSSTPSKGLTEAQAEALAQRLTRRIGEWEQKHGLKVVYTDLAGMGSLALHIKDADGTCKPLRTTQEIDYYNRLKQFAAQRKPNEVLDFDDLILLGLDVTPKNRDKTVNLFLALLTTHNVMRLLARPEQWQGEFTDNPKPEGFYGHPKTDSAYPILTDLLGMDSTGGQNFPTICESLLNVRWRPEHARVVDGNWTVTLFGTKGIFKRQAGIEYADNPTDKDHWNGGCHYYYWIGALAAGTLGPAGVMYGELKEKLAKIATGEGGRGEVEITYFSGGALFLARFNALRGMEKAAKVLEDAPFP